ncbi:MAG TPA: HEAT repeat domain-containing protein [Bryobacteraceae bacterium]|nr:HEAT repeat domain-containing protein [Bryobacteraceae bacterium]
MNCSEFAIDIADTLAGEALPAARARAEAHLAECSACRANAALWDKLGGLPEAAPAPNLQTRFEKRLQPRIAAPSRTNWQWLAAAAALILGVFGFLAGRYSAPRPPEGDMASLRKEVRNLREVVALSLLDQQSASERLRGIRYSASLDGSDPEVVDALSRTLRSDPSVDVRLAAADALRRFPMSATVSESAWQLLEQDDSPLVQIAVIDLLVSRKDPSVRARLTALKDRSGLDSNVRDYLQALLSNQRTKGNPYQ